jgi:exonuclease SbcC
MHLQQLKIKNLASLRGEHLIDFTLLASQDLFAITGETGAGKSTLLNALSLALYGKVYRSQTFSTDLVTLGEKDASVEVQFSVRGVQYLIKWSITVLKKDGSPIAKPKPNRAVYKFEQDEYRIQEVEPQEVLGLDFDQFSKCVVLNQGEFARFLTASFTERRNILEKLYPSDNLDTVGGLAKKRFEAALDELKTLDIQVHGLTGETLFDVEAASGTLKKHEEISIASQKELKTLRPWAQGLEELMNFAAKYVETEKRKTLQEVELLTRTEVHNFSMKAAHEGQRLIEVTQALLDKDTVNLEKDDQEARALLQLKTTLAEKTNQHADLSQQLKRFEIRLDTLKADEAKLTQELKLLATRPLAPLAALEALPWTKIETLIREIPVTQLRMKQAQTELLRATELGVELARDLKEKKEKNDQLITTLPEKWRTTSDLARELQAARELVTRIEMTSAERSKLTIQITHLKEEWEQVIPQLQKLELEFENASLRLALNQLKTQLKTHPPDECPLCQHPVKNWGTHLQLQEANFDSKKLQEIKDQQLRRETLLGQYQKALAELPILETTLKPHDLDIITQTHTEITKLATEMQSIEKRLNDSRTQWKLLNEEKIKTDEKNQTLEESTTFILKEINSTLKTNHLWSIDLIKTLSDELQLARKLTGLELALATLKKQISELQRDMDETSVREKELATTHAQLLANYQERQAKLNAKYPNSTPLETLKKRQEEVKLLQHKGQLLQQDFRQKELHLAEARSNLSRVVEQLQQIEINFAENKIRLNSTRPIEVSILDAHLVLPSLLQIVKTDIEALENKARESDTEIGKLKTILLEDQKRREKKALLEQQQQLAKEKSHRWKRLLDVLGADDMRTYVLSLVEAALIEQTNHELERLCAGRYVIQHSHKKERPEFWVIDRWRDGLIRKVSTLSGGETFMVSLAMALGLAEMARGRADIDCFFIDEGFGTLDENSLEDVMDMLQQVRSRGKQIGLITHVKALSQRLPLNLVVTKNTRGNSSLEIVYS